MSVPDLSVIVTVVDGNDTLRRCLESLSNQSNGPALEIIVPYDDTVPEVGYLVTSFPSVRFLPLGPLHKNGIPLNEFRRHILYDRRRAAGLQFAHGRLIAILEDRGRPHPDWARTMVDLHDRTQYSAIGGAIENVAGGILRWAVFFSDFGRYQSPVEQENPEYVSDINICYKREALESVHELWQYRYQEPVVNWALRRNGQRLYLSDRPVVLQERAPIGLWQVIQERLHWGRTFGQIRARDEQFGLRSAVWLAAMPVLGIFLFIRHLRQQLSKKRNVANFFLASPALFVLLHVWIAGEFMGYCETAFGFNAPSIE